MTKKEIKQRLYGYTALSRELEQIKNQIRTLEGKMTAPRAQALDGMPHGPGGGDALASIVAQHLELQELYQVKAAALAREIADIEHLIAGLEPTERRLARCRYLQGLTWEEVCVEMSYSWRQVHRLHGKMLDKLANEQNKGDEKKCD